MRKDSMVTSVLLYPLVLANLEILPVNYPTWKSTHSAEWAWAEVGVTEAGQCTGQTEMCRKCAGGAPFSHPVATRGRRAGVGSAEPMREHWVSSTFYLHSIYILFTFYPTFYSTFYSTVIGKSVGLVGFNI